MNPAQHREHALKNYLAIIIGYTELLIQETSADDPRRPDFVEMHRAATQAVRLVAADWDASA